MPFKYSLTLSRVPVNRYNERVIVVWIVGVLDRTRFISVWCVLIKTCHLLTVRVNLKPKSYLGKWKFKLDVCVNVFRPIRTVVYSSNNRQFHNVVRQIGKTFNYSKVFSFVMEFWHFASTSFS